MRGFAGGAAGLALALGAGAASAQSLETLVTTPSEPLIIESVARDAEGALILSSVHAGRLYEVGADGRMTAILEDPELGFYGLAADPDRRVLYAAAAVRPGGDADAAETLLLRIDLASGAVLDRSSPEGIGHRFGDVAVGPDGTAYVADIKALRIWRWRPGGKLEPLVILPEGASPQGMAVSGDGRWLVFADYRNGLHRIDLSQGPVTLTAAAYQAMAKPDEGELRGIDGLARHGDAILAMQNGTRTNRVLRLTMTADWSAVTAREALVEGAPLNDPTTGFVEGDSLVFVSRSQWTDFGRDGPTTPTPAPAVVSRLSLSEEPSQ